MGKNELLAMIAILDERLEQREPTPLQMAADKIQKEQCDARGCVEAMAARKVGYGNRIMHVAGWGHLQKHHIGYTAASDVDELKGCNSILLDGSSPNSGDTVGCPLCGANPIMTGDIEVQVVQPQSPQNPQSPGAGANQQRERGASQQQSTPTEGGAKTKTPPTLQ